MCDSIGIFMTVRTDIITIAKAKKNAAGKKNAVGETEENRMTFFDLKNHRYMMSPDTGDNMGAGNAAAPEGSATTGTQTQPQSFDDFLKSNPEFQREFDRRTSKALDTAKTKWQADAEAARTEAERLAKMSAEQRAAEEMKQKLDALAKREQEVSKRELMAQAKEELTGRGMPTELLSALDLSSADNCKSSMDTIEAVWRAAIQSGVNERMKGTTPKNAAGSAPDTSKMTDEEYYKYMETQQK